MELNVLSGVHHGAVLGLLLFSLHTIMLINILQKISTRKYNFLLTTMFATVKSKMVKTR